MDPVTSKHPLFSLDQSSQHLSPWPSVLPPLSVCIWAALSFMPIRKRGAELASVLTAVSLTDNGAGKVGEASPSDPAKSLPTKVAQAHSYLLKGV